MAVILAVGACSSDKKADDGRTTVVASFFALAELVRGVAPEADVIDLTPPGVEPHDLELTAKQIDQIEDADAVVLLGGGFQPAIERAAKRASGRVITIDPESDDPHVWLDPGYLGVIEAKLLAELPYKDYVAGYRLRLMDLAAQYEQGLRTCQRRVIVTAHDAFGHLARRYKLEAHALTGISPEAEPNPQRLAELADLVRRTGTTTVFTEELVSPKVAEALAREAGVKTDVLDTLESGTEGTFLNQMGANLAKLQDALGCT